MTDLLGDVNQLLLSIAIAVCVVALDLAVAKGRLVRSTRPFSCTVRPNARRLWPIVRQCKGRVVCRVAFAVGICLAWGWQHLWELAVPPQVAVAVFGGAASIARMGVGSGGAAIIIALGLWFTGSSVAAGKRAALHGGWTCPKCEYDLYSLADSRATVERCPECGMRFQGLGVPEVWVGMYYLPTFDTRRGG